MLGGTGAVSAILTALLVGGCAGHDPAEPRQSPAPGDVALSYVEATFSSDPSSARRWVEPASQDAYRIVELGIGDQKLSARDLGVGSTSIDGDRATVVMLGTLCRQQPGREQPKSEEKPEAKTTTPAPDCITNTDPRSANPVFRVLLARQPDGSWLVSLRIDQPATPTPGAAPGAATSSAARR